MFYKGTSGFKEKHKAKNFHHGDHGEKPRARAAPQKNRVKQTSKTKSIHHEGHEGHKETKAECSSCTAW